MNEFNKIQNKLIIEENLEVVQAAILTADILNYYDATIKKAILAWADGKDMMSFSIEETTVKDIVEELDCSVYQALALLNATNQNRNIFDTAVLVLERDEVQ